MNTSLLQIGTDRIPPLPALLMDLRRAARESPEDSAKRRRTRFERLVEHARSGSPFYRKKYSFLPGKSLDPTRFPPVSKRELAENFDEWSTDRNVRRETAKAFISDPSLLGRLYLERYVAISTSGTTGTPSILLQDMGAMSVYRALLLARRVPSLLSARALPPFLRNGARTATIIATGGHFASSVVDALVRSMYPRLHAFNRTFSLMEPIPRLVEELNRHRPAVLGSYPTALAVLAEEQEAKRLRISPALVLTGAERLSPPLRDRIAAAFRCPVRDTYAASEFMGIAYDCRHGRLHVNSDWVILEPVDAGGKPVPDGVPSHTTLLTNLANRVQPLIRYDLGDSVTMLPGNCPCGSSLPGIRPQGRSDEILRIRMPDGTSLPLLPLVLATVVEEAPGVLRYQLVRTGPDALRLRVEEAPGRDRGAVCGEALRRLRAYLSSQGIDPSRLALSDERPEGAAAGGKSRPFLSEPFPP